MSRSNRDPERSTFQRNWNQFSADSWIPLYSAAVVNYQDYASRARDKDQLARSQNANKSKIFERKLLNQQSLYRYLIYVQISDVHWAGPLRIDFNQLVTRYFSLISSPFSGVDPQF